MKVLFSHPTGNANARAAAKGLFDQGLLFEFHTSIASFPGNFIDHLGAFSPLAEIRRRRFDSALQPFTKTWPWIEAGRLIASKAGFTKLTDHEFGLFCIDAVYRSLDRRVALSLKKAGHREAKAVYAYEDEAVISFRKAKHLGMQCLYDLPIGYWRTARRLLQNEKDRWPDWSATLTGFNDSEIKLNLKDEELSLANRIFVASSFTAGTLKEFPGTLAPVHIIPYGFPEVGDAKDYSSLSGNRPLKLLFVGGLSQRKGIADLFAAAKLFGERVKLTIVGGKVSDNCPALDAELAKHNWIQSLPHRDILSLMRENDVFIFPSLFEGFGLVITEAMSQGTPVITTDRTAGPDFIQHGENGWLINAGSTNSIVSAIEELLIRPKTIAEAGRRAMETARGRPWEVYGDELAKAIEGYLSDIK